MVIKAVSKTENGEYVTLTLSCEKKSLVITGEVYSAIGAPTVGYELSEEEYSLVLSDDAYYRATLRALNILSFGDNSRRKLYEKLRGRGVDKEIAERVVSNMAELGYIDEHRQLVRLVSDLANHSLIGPYKISAKLMAAGYSPSDVRAVISELTERCEVDFEENFARLALRTLGDDADTEALLKLKYKYGYKK